MSGHGRDYATAKAIGKDLYNAALSSDKLGIDIKTQVTVRYDQALVESQIEKVIVAIPMVAGKEKEAKKEVLEIVRRHAPKEAKVIINGTGAYCQHGPIADCGTTGRKLAVDFYGGRSRIGGGCVDGDTEYLSETGWKKIKDYDGGLVGQLTDNLELERVNPEGYIKGKA